MAASTSLSDEEYKKNLMSFTPPAFFTSSIALGKELGLFEAIEKVGCSGTVEEIAAAAKAKPRYTKEWLSTMACAKVLDFNPETGVFSVPPHRLPGLKESARKMVWFTRFIKNYDQVLKAFPEGGQNGFVPWEKSSFDDIMNEERELWNKKEGNLDTFIDHTEGLREKLEKGISVCEAGSSMGYMLIALAERFPNSKFTGFDICPETVKSSREQAANYNLSNITLLEHDINNLPSDWLNSFDYVYVFDAMHDLPSPSKGVKHLTNIVKKGGHFSLVDFDISSNLKDNLNSTMAGLYYSVSSFYCLSYSLHCGGEGAGTCYGKENFTRDIHDAGLKLVQIAKIPDSVVEIHYVCVKL